jgi:hypothetical protein
VIDPVLWSLDPTHITAAIWSDHTYSCHDLNPSPDLRFYMTRRKEYTIWLFSESLEVYNHLDTKTPQGFEYTEYLSQVAQAASVVLSESILWRHQGFIHHFSDMTSGIPEED